VLIAFTNAGGNGNKIFYSPDGKTGIGVGPDFYNGSSRVQAIVSAKDGVFVAFQDKASQSCGGGFTDLGCTINKAGGQLLEGIGKTAVSILKNPGEIFPICWGSPQNCREPVTGGARGPVDPNPIYYSASARIPCVDAVDGTDRADNEITMFSKVSRDDAINQIIYKFQTEDLCKAHDASRKTKPGAQLEWIT
jgi:hypothetical protein